MALCSKNKNPLQRSGTGQTQRLLPAMQDDYVHINENKYEDWIVFAAEFSVYLKFYSPDDQPAGDWTPFFTNDISSMLGSIAIQDIDAYKRTIKARFDFIKNDANAVDENAVKQKLNELFSIIITLSKALDEYALQLPAEIALKTTIQNLIRSKLALSLQKLLAYYVAAVDALPLSYIADSDFIGLKVLGKTVTDAGEIIHGTGLSKIWWLNKTSWDEVVPDPGTGDNSIFSVQGGTDYQKINHAANHNLFVAVFNQYLTVYANIITDAKKQLLQTLEQWGIHPAHYALFLAFLKLFATAKDHINTLKQRHLDYYYKEILRLEPRKALPNQAHILIELTKQTHDYILKKDQSLKAGKDSNGSEIIYAADKDFTFNKAKVALLKSVYIAAGNGKDDIDLINNRFRLFASAVTDSEDGSGEALTSANKEWHPFANKKYKDGKLNEIKMPLAQIGFAIASHYLYLSEGERKVFIKLTTSNNTALVNKRIECYLTTDKAWYKVPVTQMVPIALSGSQAIIHFTLYGDAPAISNYNAKVHGGKFDVDLPLLKVMLVNDGYAYEYKDLKNITVSSVEVRVEVGTMASYSNTGLKQLLLLSENGPLDAAKPFQPFGAQPKKDSIFVIGSKEVFCKKNSAVTLNIEWAKLPADAKHIKYSASSDNTVEDINANVDFLFKSKWNNSDQTDVLEGVDATHPAIRLFSPLSIPNDAIIEYENQYMGFNIASKAGFLRLVLQQDFGYSNYLSDLTSHLIEVSKPGATVTPFGGKEPYTPTIQSLYLSYTAFQTVNVDNDNAQDFEGREIRFFHLYPFGEAEQHAYLNKNETQHLLPQFTWPSATGNNYCGAEFYIGIENLAEHQSVNILFQVLDGSSNPETEKPLKHISWSYLAKNEWCIFEDNAISDTTMQLVQSGIISFTIPAGATTDNSMLPSGYLWIRASVAEAADAVCKLIGVYAQAALVALRPNNNADDLFEKPLPAGTISKLKTPDAAVKKITQPYPSFGGRAKEQTGHYYIRVSERLRHKGRAVTIWDYEHLVLEAFPDIHKVKCLNHTQIAPNIYNETQPGHVSVITIPSLVNRNDINPLRPYTNANRLIEIEEFLKQKVSCNVKLRVHNPQFEEVRLRFLLQLAKGYDDFTIYSKLLQEEITSFLTPWAYNSKTDIQFGGKIYKSSLINFIEERAYVDFVVNVEMYHRIETDGESQDLEEINASTARSILVSAPAAMHEIVAYPEE